MVLGCAQSPQWRQLVLGNHCHAPIQPCCSTPSVLSIAGGFWQYLKSRRKGIQRGAQEGGVSPSWCCVIFVYCGLPRGPRFGDCAFREFGRDLFAPFNTLYLPFCPLGATHSYWVQHLGGRMGPITSKFPTFPSVSFIALLLPSQHLSWFVILYLLTFSNLAVTYGTILLTTVSLKHQWYLALLIVFSWMNGKWMSEWMNDLSYLCSLVYCAIGI